MTILHINYGDSVITFPDMEYYAILVFTALLGLAFGWMFMQYALSCLILLSQLVHLLLEVKPECLRVLLALCILATERIVWFFCPAHTIRDLDLTAFTLPSGYFRTQGTECVICMENEPKKIVQLCACSHRFHADCLTTWMNAQLSRVGIINAAVRLVAVFWSRI